MEPEDLRRTRCSSTTASNRTPRSPASCTCIFSIDTREPARGLRRSQRPLALPHHVCIVYAADGDRRPVRRRPRRLTEECATSTAAAASTTPATWSTSGPCPATSRPQGIFSDVNPKITCPDGTYYMVPPEEIGTRVEHVQGRSRPELEVAGRSTTRRGREDQVDHLVDALVDVADGRAPHSPAAEHAPDHRRGHERDRRPARARAVSH